MTRKRIETYREMSSILGEAQRIVIFHGSSDKNGQPMLSNLMHCANSSNKSDACKIDISDSNSIALAKDVFEL
jgi:hypothetical protein